VSARKPRCLFLGQGQQFAAYAPVYFLAGTSFPQMYPQKLLMIFIQGGAGLDTKMKHQGGG
jgi:hypothetical protein